MIVDMDKYLFIGIKEDLDIFFERAQKQGTIEFVSSQKKSLEMPKDLQELTTAIRILKKEVTQHKNEFGKERNASELSKQIIELKTQIETLHEEKRNLIHEIKRVEVFGDFSMEDIKDIEKRGHQCIQFFGRKKSKIHEDQKLPEEMIEVGADAQMQYFISIAEEKVFHKDFTEIHIEEPVSDLMIRLSTARENLKKFQHELKELLGYLEFLNEELLQRLNVYHLDIAKHTADHTLEDHLFYIEAWIPREHLNEVFPLLQKIAVHMEQVAIKEGDQVPTYLQNKECFKSGEDLVKIYDIPSHNDKDPSIFILIAFALFFSMIVSDAGYGAIYLTLSLLLYFKTKKKKSEVGFRMAKMAVLISSVCVVWGVLTSSYFGIQVAPQNPLQKASLIQYLVKKKALYHIEAKDDVYQEWVTKDPQLATVQDPMQFILGGSEEKPSETDHPILEEFTDNILMEIALLVGVIHICISLFRYAFRTYASIGWVLFIIGGYLFFPSVLNATSFIHIGGVVSKSTAKAVGEQLIYIGIGLAFFLSLLQNKLRGLEEPLKVIQIFSDILSYLRLYALALAGMIMGATFNQIGKDVGFVFGFFIIIIGHITNMGLGIMGGVIHGLRLNFLEWYHYSFEGGGKLFKPLKLFHK